MGLIWLGLAWMIGIALGYGRDLRSWWPILGWLAVALLASATLWPRLRRTFLWATLLLGVCALAVWRVGLIAPTAATLPAGTISGLRGQVIDWPERGDRRDEAIVAVEAARVGTDWQPASARVRADVPLAPTVGRGDQLELYGYYRPTGEIDLPGFRQWLEQRDLHGHFQASASRVLATGERTSIGARRFALLGDVEGRLRRHIPGAEGALATGILLGDDSLLPRQTRDAFDATSTSHTMALSGWNITIIAGACALIGRTLRRARSQPWLLGSALAIVAFVAFVGTSPTLVRAAIMGSFYLLAEALGRRGDALTALAASAVLMTALAPATILDIGFQLSCVATAGLILIAPGLTDLLRRGRLPGALAAVAAATMAAEIATFPLILHHFGRLSRLTLPANLLVEPLVPAIMLTAFLTALLSYPPGPLGDLVGLVAWIPTRLMLLVVETLGALPWAVQRFPTPGWPLTLALYALFGIALSAPHWLPALRTHASGLFAPARPSAAPFLAGLFGGLALSAWLLLLFR